MNRQTHTLIFNAARGCLMAVAESARRTSQTASGQRQGRRQRGGGVRGTVAALGLVLTGLTQAQIVADPSAPGNQRPTVLPAPNGVPVVNIQTPSAAGVSRNTYSQFDVQGNGAILNNSRGNVQTQLGGWVQGNPWLAGGSARIILNEVNSSNPSRLHGYIEVAGQRAEVVIANPAGIDVAGAGFINASRATLTTGTPVVSGGSLEGYRVQRGVIRINGAGLDATLTDYTGILARAINVNAAVHARELRLITGDNTIHADQNQAQAAVPGAASGSAPTFALDVSQLGGMYAGKITLVGTEAGVGVRHQGVIGASAGDVHIDTNGWLSSAGRIQASQGNIHIQTAQAQTHSGSLLAAGNLNLHSGTESTRAALDNSGAVRAGLEAHIRASDLGNAGQIDAQRLDVAVASLANSGDIWQSGSQALSVQAATLNNAQGAAIGAVQVPGAAPAPAPAPSPAPAPTPAPAPSPAPAPAPSPGPAPVPLANGLISVTGTLNNSGAATLAGAGDLNLSATQTLTNAGHIRAQSVQSSGQRFENSAGALQTQHLNVQVDTVALDGGAVVAHTASLTSSAHNQAQGAQLYTHGTLRVQTQRLANAGEIQSASTGRLDVDHTLANTGTVAAAGDLTINAGALSSSGTLVAGLNSDGTLQPFAADAAALTVTTTGELVATGKNLAAGAMILAGTNVDLGNSRSRAHSAAINSAGVLNTSGGQVITTQDLNVSADSVNNTQGQILAGRDLSMVAGHAIGNAGGQIVADGSVNITANTLGLDGTLQSGGHMTLDLVGDLGTASGQQVRAGGDLSVQLLGGHFSNAGQWQAGQNLSVRADHISNHASGELLSLATTTLDVTQSSTGTVTNRGLIDGADTHISSHTVDNVGSGRIYGGRIAIAANTLNNREETVNGQTRAATIAARERLDIGARHISNREGALLFSAGDMAIGGALDANHRAITDGSASAQTLNNNSATIESLGNMALAVQTLRNTNEHLAWNLVPQSQSAQTEYYTAQGHINTQNMGWHVDGQRKFMSASSTYGAAQYKGYYQGPQPFVEAHNQSMGSGDGEYNVYVPDTFNYGRTSPIWGAMGLAQPTWDAPGPRPQQTCDDGGCSSNAAALAEWQQRAAPWYELNNRFASFTQTVNQQLLAYDVYRQYTETVQDVQVLQTQPALISAGGGLHLQIADSALNRDSAIVAGGAMSGALNAVTNEATQVAAPTLRSGTVYDWGTVGEDCNIFGAKCDPEYGWRSNPYQQNIARSVPLAALRFEQNTASAGSGITIAALSDIGSINPAHTGDAQTSATPSQGASATMGLGSQSAPTLVLPGSSLFQANPGSSAGYLVETDPRFASHRQWLSSDYLLSALSIDPATTQKRLGDGFYEQKLIREQVASLTGYRFLGDYRSDEAQYMGLMTAGATFAQAQQLRPGIALSAAQVAQLTSDIVWLVTREVSLPGKDGQPGRRTTALVPQVYLAPRTGDLAANGQLFGGAHGAALISARDIQLALSGDLNNSASIAGRRLLDISAQNIQNSGLLQGELALLNARGDIDIQGGQVLAQTGMNVQAGGDLNITSSTAQGQGAAGNGVFTSQGLDRVAGLYVTGPAGVLLASAGGDVNLSAAQIHNAGSGSTRISAGGSVKLGTVQTGERIDVSHDSQNYARVQMSQDVGTQISGGGEVSIQAGQDVNLRAAQINAQGALSIQAEQGDVNIEAGQSAYGIQSASHTKASGWLGSTTVTERQAQQSTNAIGSELGGHSVAISSGLLRPFAGLRTGQAQDDRGDIRISGSSVIADQALNIQAGRDVSIEAAQNTQSSGDFNETRKSGLFSGGGLSITIGKQQQSLEQKGQSTSAAASTVGAINGNVNITAGQSYTQSGSDLLTPGGDINIKAQRVNIEEARETGSQSSEQKFKQSGLTLAITAPVLSALQAAQGQLQAAGNTPSSRMQALGAASAVLNLKQALGAVQAGQAQTGGNAADQAGGIGISLSVGSSSSQSQQQSSADSARGSTLTAGGNVNISARGAGKDSDLTIQGSNVKAGGTASLKADDQVNLLAAQNTTQESSSQQSKSGSIGVGMQLGAGGAGIGVTASASKATGQGAGSGTSYSNTHVGAQRVEIESGGDTTLKGAVVKGEQVTATVGGDLLIESLQDSSRYQERSQSAGGSVMVGAGFSASVSLAKSRIDSDYTSVAEQSAIRAGDGGFNINVQGNTELTGGQITSTDQAVQSGKNSFQTGATLATTDLQNSASYQAKSASVGLGTAGLSGAGIGSDKGAASSSTVAAISGLAGHSAARTGDLETGIAAIFDKERVKQEIDAQVAITQEAGKRIPKFIGDEFDKQRNGLQAQARAAGARGDTAQSEALLAEADKWDEGGSYRVAAHAVVGALMGGGGGALGAGAASAAAPTLNELQSGLQDGLQKAGLSDQASKAMASLTSAAAAAALGAAAGGGTVGVAAAFNADMNNRQLHPGERQLAQDLARKSGGKYTTEQIENALRNAGNTETGESIVAGMVINPNQRDAIYDKGVVWTVGESGTLIQVLPPKPDAEVVAYIKQNTGQTYDWYAPSNSTATTNTQPRDRMTNLPLDEKGRYSQTVVLGGKAYAPKYHPCASTECLRTGSNLDMSDPATQAYVKALDQQVFKDIGTGATVGTLVTPVGVPGAALAALGILAAAGEVAVSDAPLGTARDEIIDAVVEKGGVSFFRDVLGHTPAAAARAAALINLAGGWGAFRERVNIDLLGVKPNEPQK